MEPKWQDIEIINDLPDLEDMVLPEEITLLVEAFAPELEAWLEQAITTTRPKPRARGPLREG